MNYSSKLLILVLLIITAASTASAKTFEFNVRENNQVFACRLTYDVALAYAGNEALKVTVSVETQGPADLEGISFESSDRNKIDFIEDGKNFSTTRETGLRTAEYSFLANIREGIEPKNYTLAIVFRYPGQLPIRQYFPLCVGVRNKGKLTVVNGSSTPEFYVGKSNKYQIELQNNFQDYATKIRSITVSSEPAGVVEPVSVPFQDVTIEPLQRKSISVDVKAAPISFTNLLNGFGDSSELIVQVDYEDGNGRVITDLRQPVKLRMKPSGATLLLAMLIGGVIGALAKCYRQKERILKLDTLLAIVVGLAVAFVAIVAKIKIMAFDISGGYDNPAMLAIISCGAALGGMPILLSIFRSPNQSSAPAQANAPTTTPSTNSAAPKPVA
ncbi:MAG TPA: hypothetical protein VJS13_12320 [Pyrinomonadaceae bacterium]|nr:hypothetical protein [Pyrinomonadaceae bacterium]